MRKMLKDVQVGLVLLTLTAGTPAFGQTPPTPAPAATPAPPPAAEARLTEITRADTSSMDAIIKALYDVISGPAGKKRDWDRFQALFIPDARLIPTGRTPQGEARIRPTNPAGYIERSSGALEQGFFEREIARRTERYGNIAHMFSTYESRRSLDDPTPFSRGINSIQLYFDGKRWWIVTVFWDSETPTNPLPAEYLTNGPERK